MTPTSADAATETEMPTRQGPVALGLILLFMVLAGLLVNFCVRLDYGPDEPDHVAYVHILATEARLPTPAESVMVQHPPLFYSLLAPL